MSAPYSFGSVLALPDGRSITVTIDVPDGWCLPSEWRELAEHAEVAQMAAGHAVGIIRRAEASRARRSEVPF